MPRRRRRYGVRCLGCGHEFSSTKDPKIFSVQCGSCGTRRTILASDASENNEGPSPTSAGVAEEPSAVEEWGLADSTPEPATMFRAYSVEENLYAVLAWLRVSPERAWAIVQEWRRSYGMQNPQGVYDLLRRHLHLDHTLAASCADHAFGLGPSPWIMVNWSLGQMPPNQRYRQAAIWRRMGVPI